MARYRKKPVTVDAHQWWRNGDHPDDRVGEPLPDLDGSTYERQEGAVVRYFRRPEPAYAGDEFHEICGYRWHRHGWIDTGRYGHTVCPGDWIVQDVEGEYYPVTAVFEQSYDPVECRAATDTGREGSA